MVKKMFTCYQSYRVVRDYGRYTDALSYCDDLEEAIDVAKNLYRADREHHYIVECWDYLYVDEEDDEYDDCEFNSIVWDSDTVLPWADV